MYDSNAEPGVIVSSVDTNVELTAASLDAFIDEIEGLEAQGRRFKRSGGLSKRTSRASDRSNGGRGREKIELVLYVSAASEKCQKALRAVHTVLERYERSQVKFTVQDLSVTPDGDADAVIFTPTLVKRAPGPRTWIVGNLDNADYLVDMLDVSGVDRRR